MLLSYTGRFWCPIAVLVTVLNEWNVNMQSIMVPIYYSMLSTKSKIYMKCFFYGFFCPFLKPNKKNYTTSHNISPVSVEKLNADPWHWCKGLWWAKVKVLDTNEVSSCREIQYDQCHVHPSKVSGPQGLLVLTVFGFVFCNIFVTCQICKLTTYSQHYRYRKSKLVTASYKIYLLI